MTVTLLYLAKKKRFLAVKTQPNKSYSDFTVFEGIRILVKLYS